MKLVGYLGFALLGLGLRFSAFADQVNDFAKLRTQFENAPELNPADRADYVDHRWGCTMYGKDGKVVHDFILTLKNEDLENSAVLHLKWDYSKKASHENSVGPMAIQSDLNIGSSTGKPPVARLSSTLVVSGRRNTFEARVLAAPLWNFKRSRLADAFVRKAEGYGKILLESTLSNDLTSSVALSKYASAVTSDYPASIVEPNAKAVSYSRCERGRF